jgi:tRNA(Ile)-lysidine synthase
MARTLLDALRAAVRRYDLLAPGDRVLVAVSGGADSVALLAALHELRDVLGIAVVAAHLDHGLRGAESAADRAFVERVTATLGVPLSCETASVSRVNLEAEARRARYAFFERAAAALAADKIATAHTKDDQAETVLLRLLRGTGTRGLLGIPPRRGRIVRPLILCDRVQVRSFLVERELEWRRDRSNFDLGRERARLRAGFLPALAREFNPRLTTALARLADTLRDEDAVLDRLATAALGADARLDCTVLRSLEAPVARRGLRHWWRSHGSGRRFGAVHVEAVLRLSEREGGGEVRVPGGTIARVDRWLTFRRGAEESVAQAYELPLAPDGDVLTPDGWHLRLCAASPATTPAPGDAVCVLDADQVAAPLTVRSRRPGDRMRSLGLGGHTSIKRLLIARRVPRAWRDGYPLVVAGGAVLWVPGCARSDLALVTEATRHAWVIRAERRPEGRCAAVPDAPKRA